MLHYPDERPTASDDALGNIRDAEGQAAATGAAAGQTFQAGALIGQDYHSGATTGVCYG